MKFIVLGLVVLSLSGCFYQTVDITDIKKATQQCEGRGGIKLISSSWVGREVVDCVDGFSQDVNNVVLREYHG